MNYLSFPGWAAQVEVPIRTSRRASNIWTHATLVDDQLQDGDLYRTMNGGLLRWDERMGTWKTV